MGQYLMIKADDPKMFTRAMMVIFENALYPHKIDDTSTKLLTHRAAYSTMMGSIRLIKFFQVTISMFW